MIPKAPRPESKHKVQSTHPKANKRTEREIELDRVDIAGHYVRGKTIREISKWIGENRHYTLSRHQVCEDLKVVRLEWREQAMQSMTALMDEQLAKLDHIESEAWDAWEKSKGELVRTRQSKGMDPRYLAAVLTVIERRCKLLGLDAPERRELSGPAGGPMKILPTVSDERIETLLRDHYGGHRQG